MKRDFEKWQAALEQVARVQFNRNFEDLDDWQKEEIVAFVACHSSYQYLNTNKKED